MLNLLPENQKKKVIREYTKRIWTTVSFGVIGVVVISATFLIPVYLMSHGTYAESLGIKQELDSRIAVSQKNTASSDIKDLTATVSVLKDYTMVNIPSKLIESVVSRKPVGISLSHFSYTPSQNSPPTVDILGKANTRADLVLFYRSLQTDTGFFSVFIPISNFAHEKDIDFSVKLIAGTNT